MNNIRKLNLIYKTFFDPRDLCMNVLYKGMWMKINYDYFRNVPTSMMSEGIALVDNYYKTFQDTTYSLYVRLEEI